MLIIVNKILQSFVCLVQHIWHNISIPIWSLLKYFKAVQWFSALSSKDFIFKVFSRTFPSIHKPVRVYNNLPKGQVFFCCCFTSQLTIFHSCRDNFLSSCVQPVLSIERFAQGHNTVIPVIESQTSNPSVPCLEHANWAAALRIRCKLSTTCNHMGECSKILNFQYFNL